HGRWKNNGCVARKHRRAQGGESQTTGEAQRKGRGEEEFVPPQALQGPTQGQRLGAPPVSAWRSASPPSAGSDTDHDTTELVKERFAVVPPSMKSNLVQSGSPETERPRPSSVVAGTRRPKLPEYQPRMGSVSPRCRLHASPPGSVSHAPPGVTASGQRRTAPVPSSSARTSGPRWKARRTS